MQSCRGDVSLADRHLQLVLEIQGGKCEKSMGVSWDEKIDGKELTFDEEWFVVSEEELLESRLLGKYYSADEPVQGRWRAITRLE